jgi:hypothetical protein
MSDDADPLNSSEGRLEKGLRSITSEEKKEKERQRNRARYEKNKEQVKARSKAYYEANRERILADMMQPEVKARRAAQKRKWDEENRDHIRGYNEARRPITREQERERYAEDPERIRVRKRAAYAADPEKVLAPKRTPEGRAQSREWDADRQKRRRAAAAERRLAARTRAEARRAQKTETRT